MNHQMPRLSIWTGIALLLFTVLVPAARTAGPAGAESDALAAAIEWSDTLPVDERVIREIDLYAADEKGKFRDGYAAELSAEMRRRVFSAVAEALGKPLSPGGGPRVDVTFPEPGLVSAPGGEGLSELEREFEESIIRTECLAFFEGADSSPDAALRTYTDPAFRMSTRSRIKRIWTDDGLDCVETDGVKFLVSPTLYCSRVADFRDSTVAMQHSQVVSNGDGYDTVYFKESLKTFVKVPGGIVFHYINFFRGSGLGGVKKSIGKGKIVESEAKVIEELGKRLSERGSSGE
ncbi:MAG: hypothetical protein H6Q78_232 [Candidatus Krumholzibacteriota bacterium]|nr:hypothetical protein [Candidatus Krumholzibacteriota bacterium]